nr:hypothetical protein [Burkholderia stabilis]
MNATVTSRCVSLLKSGPNRITSVRLRCERASCQKNDEKCFMRAMRAGSGSFAAAQNAGPLTRGPTSSRCAARSMKGARSAALIGHPVFGSQSRDAKSSASNGATLPAQPAVEPPSTRHRTPNFWFSDDQNFN